LNEFWFAPGAPPTKITKLIVTPQSIGGDVQRGISECVSEAGEWGIFDLLWHETKNPN